MTNPVNNNLNTRCGPLFNQDGQVRPGAARELINNHTTPDGKTVELNQNDLRARVGQSRQKANSDFDAALEKARRKNPLASEEELLTIAGQKCINRLFQEMLGQKYCHNDECTKDHNDKSFKLKSCSGCRKVQYCSKECQKQAWKAHKAFCKRHRQNQSSSSSNG